VRSQCWPSVGVLQTNFCHLTNLLWMPDWKKQILVQPPPLFLQSRIRVWRSGRIIVSWSWSTDFVRASHMHHFPTPHLVPSCW
jgi:hypothetical protein